MSDLFLWEDLQDIEEKTHKALDALRGLEQAIRAGTVRHPTREDSSRLNRLLVLAELLYSEARPWIDELGLQLSTPAAEAPAQVSAPHRSVSRLHTEPLAAAPRPSPSGVAL
jgi:hypothetical protein